VVSGVVISFIRLVVGFSCSATQQIDVYGRESEAKSTFRRVLFCSLLYRAHLMETAFVSVTLRCSVRGHLHLKSAKESTMPNVVNMCPLM
jgi:hypothetical protein